MPIDAREDLGDAPISPTVLRPTTLGTDLIGLVRGGGWTPLTEWDAQNWVAKPIPDNVDPAAALDMRSTGSFHDFPTLRFDREGTPADVGQMRPILSGFETYVGSATNGPDLHLSRIYWGADAEVRIVEQPLLPASAHLCQVGLTAPPWAHVDPVDFNLRGEAHDKTMAEHATNVGMASPSSQ